MRRQARPQSPQNLVTQADYPHKGTLFYDGVNYAWEEFAGGEIRFNKGGLLSHDREAYVPLSALQMNADDELNIVNKLLAHYRPHALPDSQGYYAAAAIVTDNGHLFVSVNNEKYITEAYVGRGCAETTAHRNAQETLGDANIQYKRVYLASGRATKQKDGTLSDKQPHHVACLCGDCRRNLRAHTHEGTEFIIIATNDGENDIARRKGAASANDVKGGEAWVINHTAMYPFPELEDVNARFNAHIKAGYFAVTDTEYDEENLALSTPLTRDIPSADAQGNVSIPHEKLMQILHAYRHPDMELQALSHEPSLENINKNLLSLVRRAYQQHGGGLDGSNNLEITAIIVKTQTGKFYPGVLVNGEAWIPSKPSGMPTTLSNAYNHIGITDVYMMHFDNNKMLQEIPAANNSTKNVFTVTYPDPGALGRLLKNAKPNVSPQVTLFPVNDAKLSEDELYDLGIQFDAREAFGPAFANPKQDVIVSRH